MHVYIVSYARIVLFVGNHFFDACIQEHIYYLRREGELLVRKHVIVKYHIVYAHVQVTM